jgi:hypothetical protein
VAACASQPCKRSRSPKHSEPRSYRPFLRLAPRARAGNKSGAGITMGPGGLANTNSVDVSATALGDAVLSLAVQFNERHRHSAVGLV